MKRAYTPDRFSIRGFPCEWDGNIVDVRLQSGDPRIGQVAIWACFPALSLADARRKADDAIQESINGISAVVKRGEIECYEAHSPSCV